MLYFNHYRLGRFMIVNYLIIQAKVGSKDNFK